MTIKDNIVAFEPSDIKRFSPAYQRALQNYCGECAVPEDELSKAVNAVIASAIAAAKANQLARLEALARGRTVESDPAKISQIDSLLDQARSVIGIPVEGAYAVLALPPKKSFVERFLSHIRRLK